jgi:hypothetical protein
MNTYRRSVYHSGAHALRTSQLRESFSTASGSPERTTATQVTEEITYEQDLLTDPSLREEVRQ